MSQHTKLSNARNWMALIVILLFGNLPMVTALEISNVQAVDITQTGAAITWTTDEPADSFVHYGQEIQALQTIGDAAAVTSHRLPLTNLLPQTEYHFAVESNNIVENNSGSLYSFTTLAPDTEAPSLSVEWPEWVKGNRLSITGTTEANAQLMLSVNGALASSAPASADGTFQFADIVVVANEFNELRITARDAAGNEATASAQIFSDTLPPKIEMNALPELLTENTIAVNGTVSENSTIVITLNDRSVATLEGTTQFDQEIQLNEGQNTLKITATDSVGWETTIEQELESDTKAPQVHFELVGGTEYYEGRADTEINGETEADASVFLYIFLQGVDNYRPSLKRAVAKVTAGADGNFTFKDVSFPPPPFTGLKELAPREVPPGLEETLIGNIGQLAQEQRKAYKIVIMAEDKTGKVGYADKVVNINTCYSGNNAFDVSPSAEFPPTPFRLDPGMMEEGRQSINAVFETKYRGTAVESINPTTGQPEPGFKISNILFQKACTRQTSETDDYKYGCQLLPANFGVQSNQDKTMHFISAGLHAASDFVESDKDVWKDFVRKRQLKLPLRILINYQEKEANGAWSQTKTQVACHDLEYFVDVPIRSQDMVPDFLANEGIDALNFTITQIENVKPYLETAIIVAGVGCVGSFLTKMTTRLYRIFMSNFEPWLTKKDEKKCPSSKSQPIKQQELLLKETIDHWRELKATRTATIKPENEFPDWLGDAEKESQHSLTELCPKTAAAWQLEATFDKLYRFTCDRFLCRPVPARWTENADEEQIQDVINAQTQCTATATGGYLTKVENCQERLQQSPVNTQVIQRLTQENVFECYENRNGILYYAPGASSEQPYTHQNIWRLVPVANIISIGQTPSDVLLAYKPEGSDTFTVGTDQKCSSWCERKPGYEATKDGFNPRGLSALSTTSGWTAGSVKPIGNNVYTRTSIPGVWSARDGNFYNEEGYRVNEAGTQYYTNGNLVAINAENKQNAEKSSEFGAWQTYYQQIYGEGACYKQQPDGSLLGQGTARVDGTKVSGGYTRDCFINYDDPADGLYQCVCEKKTTTADQPRFPAARTALKKKDASAEKWFYHQDRIYAESGKKLGTNYPKNRYYDGRDFTGGFGLNSGLDNFKDNTKVTEMSDTRIDPKDYIDMFQSVCLRGIWARLNMLQSTLIGMRNCIQQAKYTGLHDAGMCKTLFTQYVCGLIYKGISYLGNRCTPQTLRDQGSADHTDDSNVFSEFFKAGFNAIPAAMDASIQEVNADYGDAQFREFFATGAQGFSESICLAAFGYDFPMGMDFIHDAAYSFSTEVTAIFPIAERELTTFDPVKGSAVYNYNLGGVMFPGCKVRGYKTTLKCIGPEDLGNPDVDRTCRSKGCDCLQATGLRPELAGERTYSVDKGSSFTGVKKGEHFDFPIESPQKVSSNFRYDHVVLEVYLDPNEKVENCIDQGRRTPTGGQFYFPIQDVSQPVSINCFADPVSGKFTCPKVKEIFGGGQTYLEHPFVQCYDKRRDEFINCDSPNVLLEGDALVIKPYLNIGGDDPACLKITDNRGFFNQQPIPLPENQHGSYSPRLSLTTITAPMIQGRGAGTITTNPGSDPGCGGNNRQVEVLATPSGGGTAGALRFTYSQQPSGKYQLTVPAGVSVEQMNGYTLNGQLLTKNSAIDLTPTEIDGAVFMASGFKFSKVFGNPIPSNPAQGQCTYELRPSMLAGASSNLGSLQLTLQVLKPGPNENCYQTTTVMPRSSFGQVTVTQPVRLQSQLQEVAAASDIHQDFLRGNYDVVLAKADPIIRREESTLANAIAVYYSIASYIAKGNGVSNFDLQIISLLNLFFKREFRTDVTLSPYPPDVKNTAQYQKINTYLCCVDKKLSSPANYQDCANVNCASGSTCGSTAVLSTFQQQQPNDWSRYTCQNQASGKTCYNRNDYSSQALADLNNLNFGCPGTQLCCSP